MTDRARLSNIWHLGQLFAVDSVLNGNLIVGEVPDMGLMYKTDMIWKAMHTLPVNRGVSVESCSYFFDLCLSGNGRTVDILVAEEASFYSRYCSGLSFSYIPVTEFALNVVVCDVDSMRESYRLCRSVA